MTRSSQLPPGIGNQTERPPIDPVANAEARWQTMLQREGGDPAKVLDSWADNIVSHYGAKYSGSGNAALELASAGEQDIPQAKGLRERVEARLQALSGQPVGMSK